MQNIINNNKIQKINRFFITSERKVFTILGVSILLLVISYAFLVFSSVTTVYALDEGKEKLASIISSNSILESEVSVKKDIATESFGMQLVAVRDISYLDSSFERLVYNK